MCNLHASRQCFYRYSCVGKSRDNTAGWILKFIWNDAKGGCFFLSLFLFFSIYTHRALILIVFFAFAPDFCFYGDLFIYFFPLPLYLIIIYFNFSNFLLLNQRSIFLFLLLELFKFCLFISIEKCLLMNL